MLPDFTNPQLMLATPKAVLSKKQDNWSIIIDKEYEI